MCDSFAHRISDRLVYREGKADLYAAFLQRGLQMARLGGTSALLTMRNWMFIKQYSKLRRQLFKKQDLRTLGDFDRGAFEEVLDEIVSVVCAIFHRSPPRHQRSTALQPTPLHDRSRDGGRTQRKRAATLAGIGRTSFLTSGFAEIADWPLVYWWTDELLERYKNAVKLGDIGDVRLGMSTSDNTRYTRKPWEVRKSTIILNHKISMDKWPTWAPTVMGAKGFAWVEPLRDLVHWHQNGLTMKADQEIKYGSSSRRIQSQDKYFHIGIAFSMIGNSFDARIHRYPSIFGNMGSSVFAKELPNILMNMNSSNATLVLSSLNPGMHFEVGDVNRLPIFPIANTTEILATIESAFTVHESHREPSIEFLTPGPSPWRHTQSWAQLAVDRPDGTPLPPYTPELDPEPPTDHLSYALGIALGRFSPTGAGILDPTTTSLAHALPAGILFLDTTLDPADLRDSLGHPASAPLLAAWATHGPAIAPDTDLRSYLTAPAAKGFFDLHRKTYENRPIHWPLSSEKRTFVAFVTIHRFTADTLRILLVDHLAPTLTRLEGELVDLRAAQTTLATTDKKSARTLDKRLSTVAAAHTELSAFITLVQACAEKGPPPPDPKRPERETDARYDPDLDDGVMINSAALYPLLLPLWKEPKKHWLELAAAKGKKDYDWAHLAMRYWPTRVDAKCRNDPSLAVAHGCFWKYHPLRAWTWELRLQDEIAPDFRIVEEPYRGDGGHEAHRTVLLADHPIDALAAVEREALRRLRKHKRPLPSLSLLEPGLWTARPEECWTLELKITEKQGTDFLLLAPDEPTGRAALLQAMPELQSKRDGLLATLRPNEGLFVGDAEDSDGGDDDDDDEQDDDGETP